MNEKKKLFSTSKVYLSLGFYGNFRQNIDVTLMLEGRCHSIEVPIKLKDIYMLSKREWLLTENESNNKYLLIESTETPMEYTLQPIQEDWQRQFDGKADQCMI